MSYVSKLSCLPSSSGHGARFSQADNPSEREAHVHHHGENHFPIQPISRENLGTALDGLRKIGIKKNF